MAARSSSGVPQLPVPGVVLGTYPQRDYVPPGATARLERMLGRFALAGLVARRREGFAEEVQAALAGVAAVGTDAFRAELRQVRARMRAREPDQRVLVQAAALASRASSDVLGCAPYRTQLIAARILLDGRLAEMATGEGKTLAAFVGAVVAALAGVPVHVLTANPYLARRDMEMLRPAFAALGLRVDCVMPEQDEAVRRAVYACDVAYGTAREVIFDYLRDRAAGFGRRTDLSRRVSALDAAEHGPQPILRGLCMAIVDEADSVLIDEARTPFVLAQVARDTGQRLAYETALEFAQRLRAGGDFTRVGAAARPALTAAGRARLAKQVHGLRGVWRHERFRAELVELALSALYRYRRDVDYVVRDDRVAIVDPTTGRLAPGRAWSQGLHQLIEIKEGLEPTAEQHTLAQLTYQRFFPRYLKLAGMSGTLTEARPELASVYGLQVERVPLLVPCRRRGLPTRVYVDDEVRWKAVCAAIDVCHRAKRPVLVGTDSVQASERLSGLLRRAGLVHHLLNARQDRAEAEIVARAGAAGRITVTTNMAGRGTDIALEQASREAGGLHVISCQANGSARIDRQLEGRAGRRGDPGSSETLLSMHEGLFARMIPAPCRGVLRRAWPSQRPLPPWIGGALVRIAQRAQEHFARAQRSRMMRHDLAMERQLGFGGPGE